MPRIVTHILETATVDHVYSHPIVATKVVGIDVSRSGSITDGSSDALGNVTIAQATEYTYTISADGDDDLVISGVTITNLTNCFVDITTDPTGVTVETGSTTNLVIDVTPILEAAFSFDISISNDTTTTENPYNFTVSGTGVISESDLVTSAGLQLWVQPDLAVDTLLDDLLVAVDSNGDNIRRWTPAVKPADLTYLEDSAASYPTWLDSGNGINGNPCASFADTADGLIDVGASFTADDLFDASAAVFVLAGRVNTFSSSGDQNIVSDTGFNKSIRAQLGTTQVKVIFDMTSDKTIPCTPSSGLFLVYAALNGNDLNYWVNGGSMQTFDVTGDEITDLTQAVWAITGAINSVDWDLLRHGAGTGSGASTADHEALRDFIWNNLMGQ